MPRLPIPGSDEGVWGDILNEFLTVELNADGSLKKASDIASKYVKPSGGIPKTDLAASVQSSLTAADNAASQSDLNDHTTAGSDAHSASAIAFTPFSTISSTNVQAAIEEVAAESGSSITLSDQSPADLAGTAAPGASSEVARHDHVHSTDGLATDADLTSHASATTSIHGITDTAQLETQTGAQNKVDTHASDTTNIHGIADTTELETQTGAQTKVDDHAAETTNIHGIANTANLETVSGAQAKVDAHSEDVADAHSASAISYDNGASGLAATDTQAAVDELANSKSSASHDHDADYVNEADHTKAAHDALALDHGSLSGTGDDDHPQYALADGSRGDFEVSGAVAAHEAAGDPHTTYLNDSRHDSHDHSSALSTAQLSDLGDVATAAPSDGQVLTFDTTNGWQPEDAPVEVTEAEFSAHTDATTNVHGIADTSVLETQSGAQTKVDAHAAATTDIHGIADTTALETQTGAQTRVDTHNTDTTNVHGIADTSVLETQSGAQTKVDAHVNDSSAAHAAAAISYDNSDSSLSATDAKSALDELDGSKADSAHAHDGDYVAVADHTKAAHDALALDHGSLSGIADDDHPQYQVADIAQFAREGTLSVVTGRGRYRFPYDVTILGVSAAVDTAPTGSDLIIDVNKNGTTLYTTQANRPTISDGANDTAETTPDVTSVNAGDYVTVDIDQVGSSSAGADLTVFVRYARTTT